jgi:hypothetical protein
MGELVLTYDRTDQRIECPHLGQAAPAALVDVTVTIYDADGESVITDDAEKGEADTTLTVAAARGARTITVDDASDVDQAQPLVITDAWGRTELVRAEGGEVVTDTIALEDPIARDYAIGAAVKSAFIYYDADLSDEATWPIGLYTAVFSCTSWSAPRAKVFRIVRTPALECPIAYENVRAALSSIGFLRDQYDPPDLDDVRLAAWQYLQADMLSSGRDPVTLREPERLAVAGGYLAAALFLVGRGNPDTVKTLAGDPPGSGGFFRSFYDKAMAVPAWFDRDQDLARDHLEEQLPRRTSVRRGL